MEAINDLRCERKFLVSELLAKEIEEVILLHPALFSTIYYERFINNIYFDNLEFLSFHENQSGTTPRKKIRIRWYGDLSENIKEPVLEIKRKFGIVGRKDFYSLPDLCFRNFLSKLETLDMIKKRHLNVENIRLLGLDDADELLESFKEQIYDIFK